MMTRANRSSGKMRMILSDEADRAKYISMVNALELGKRRFLAEVKVYRKKRSIKSNNLYWMWLTCIKDETGNDVETLHAYFKRKYLPWKSVPVFDDEIIQATSTTALNTKEFFEYMEKIKQEMLAQSIFLPEPGDQGYEPFYMKYGEQ
jgi:hypothetical protein